MVTKKGKKRESSKKKVGLKSIAMSTTIATFFTMSFFMFRPLLSPYLKNQGFTVIQISWMLSVFPLVSMFISPILGSISDAIGRKKVIFTGIILQILACFLYLLDEYVIVIVIARIFDAIAFAAVTFIILAKVNDLVDNSNRGKLSGMFFSIMHLGTILGPLFGAFLADYFFIKLPFVVSMVLLTLLLLMFLVYKPHKHRKLQAKDVSFFKTIKYFITHRKLRGMAIQGMGAHFSLPLRDVFVPLFIVSSAGLAGTYKDLGYIAFAFGIFRFFQFLCGRLSDKYGRKKILYAGYLILGLTFLQMSFVNSIAMLFLVALMYSIGNSLWNVSAWAYMSDIGEEEKKEGSIIGGYVFFAKTGSFISYLVSGVVITFYGFRTLCLIAGTIILIAGVTSTFFLYEKPPKLVQKPHIVPHHALLR